MKKVYLILLLILLNNLMFGQDFTLIFEERGRTEMEISSGVAVSTLNVTATKEQIKLFLKSKAALTNASIEILKGDKVEATVIENLPADAKVDITIGFLTAVSTIIGVEQIKIKIGGNEEFVIDVATPGEWLKSVVEAKVTPCNISNYIPDISSRNKPKNKFVLSKNYTYVYDVLTGKSGVYKLKKNNEYNYVNEVVDSSYISQSTGKKRKKLHPVVDQEFSVVFLNNSKFDSTEVNKTETNFNNSDDHGFGKVLKGGDQVASGAAATSNNGKKSTTSFNVSNLDQLQMDLNAYARFLSKYEITNQELEVDRSFIKATVGSCFGDGSFHIDSVQLSLLKSFPKRTAVVADVMLNMRYIMKYSNPTQVYKLSNIPNVDVLELDIKGYQGKKKIPVEKIKIRPSLGLKIDYSPALIFSTVADHSYQILDSETDRYRVDTTYFIGQDFIRTDSITAIDSVRRKIIRKKDSNDFTIGAGAFAHFYPRTGKWLNVSLSIGAMIDNNAATQYLGGLSLIMGPKERIIINGGFSLGQVDRLRSRYDTSRIYNPEDLNNISDDQLTYKSWEHGMFISISYNLSGESKKNEDKK